MTLVSVIIPTFNRAALLDRCLRSVLALPISDMEVLVADNASEDNTQEILNSITDKRLVFYRNEFNIGIEKNILNLLKNAHGKWLFCLTDDDYLLLGGLERLLTVAQSDTSLGVILSSATVVDITGKPLWTYHFYNETHKFAPGMDALVNMVWAAHVFSRILVRKEWIDLEGIEQTLGSMYSQMYMIGSVLREHAGYYLEEATVAHTTGNETAWDYPVDFMLGGKLKLIKTMLPVPQWKKERRALINQITSKFQTSHMSFSMQKSLSAFLKTQWAWLHYPEIVFSINYWKYLILFLIPLSLKAGKRYFKSVARRIYGGLGRSIKFVLDRFV